MVVMVAVVEVVEAVMVVTVATNTRLLLCISKIFLIFIA